MVDFYGFHIGKYTKNMDGMGIILIISISIVDIIVSMLIS